jgi:hypothetical protein
VGGGGDGGRESSWPTIGMQMQMHSNNRIASEPQSKVRARNRISSDPVN